MFTTNHSPGKRVSVKLLMIDNYDSFTFNLVHLFEQIGINVVIKRNDEVSIDQIKKIDPTHIVISPGPCTPNEAGISLETVTIFRSKVPILGVCLGHQVIAQNSGAKIIKANKILHGKTSKICHNSKGIFDGLPQNFQATRYHSLTIDSTTLSTDLETTAWTADQFGNRETIMGIRHKKFPIYGIQFHPESVLSEFGFEMLSKFVSLT